MTSPGRLTARPAASAAPAVQPGVHRLGTGPRGAVLVVPPSLPRPAPLLVFFHGAGGSAAQSLPAVRFLAEEQRVLLLLPSSAQQTWDLLVARLGPDVRTLDEHLAAVLARHPVDRVALGGFSDGASYALSIGLANGDLVESVLALSPGFAAPPDQVGRPRVWVSHGTDDRVLPIDVCGRRVVRTLRAAGYDVTYEEFRGGHDLTPELLRAAASAWLDPA